MAIDSSRTRLDPADRRAQILDVARELFAERSYAAVSTAELAAAAGVRRGLLHHYFGSKRQLYVEVVRDLMRNLAVPFEPADDIPVDQAVAANVRRWLDYVEANKTLWFAAVGAKGFGRDPEIERLAAQARDATVEQIIAVVRAPDSPELRAVLRTFGGVAETATREWLIAETLSREQTEALLSATLLAMVTDVARAVQRATAPPAASLASRSRS